MNKNSTVNKVRILHLTHEMAVGGTQQVISQLVNNLDAERFDCEIACIDGEIGLLGQGLVDSGIRFHVFNRNSGLDTQLIRSLRTTFIDSKIDIVHCHQYTPYVYGVLAAVLTGVKVIFTEHGRFYPDRYSWKRRMVNPLLQCFTNEIVAISAATADALAHYEWFRRRSIKVIYNGTRPDVVPQDSGLKGTHGIAEGEIVFGTIARFDEIKNLPMMIAAFNELHATYPDVKLLMVGDGDQRPQLDRLVNEFGLSANVIFTGYQVNTGRYMSIIDVYLLTSFSEGTSMTLLEAMANAKCPVVTAVGGNVEIVEHSKSGVVVDSEDTATLAKWMVQLVEDESMRSALGLAARAVFEQRFSVSTMVRQYSETYLKVAKPPDLSNAFFIV